MTALRSYDSSSYKYCCTAAGITDAQFRFLTSQSLPDFLVISPLRATTTARTLRNTVLNIQYCRTVYLPYYKNTTRTGTGLYISLSYLLREPTAATVSFSFSRSLPVAVGRDAKLPVFVKIYGCHLALALKHLPHGHPRYVEYTLHLSSLRRPIIVSLPWRSFFPFLGHFVCMCARCCLSPLSSL